MIKQGLHLNLEERNNLVWRFSDPSSLKVHLSRKNQSKVAEFWTDFYTTKLDVYSKFVSQRKSKKFQKVNSF